MRRRLRAPRRAVRDVEVAHRREAAGPVEIGEPEPVLVGLRERSATCRHPRRVGELRRPARVPLEVLVDRNDLGHGDPPNARAPDCWRPVMLLGDAWVRRRRISCRRW